MLNKILEQIFPTTCGMCGRVNLESICNRCKAKIKKEYICKTQIKYIHGEFIKYIYLFRYNNELRKIMLSYKFKEKIYLYDFFVKTALKNKKAYDFLKKYDIIIPVPLYYKKLKYRGYNQSELISSNIAKSIGSMQARNDIFVKVKNNLKQSSLDLAKRKNNVTNVYAIKDIEKHKQEFKGKNILIFDDICTTMSTISESIRILKELEPKSIGVVTIFKD